MNLIADIVNKLHTTELGVMRVKRNMGLASDTDVIKWATDIVTAVPKDSIIRCGKNWYIYDGDSVITINAHSYTLITAHRIKK